MLFLYDTRTILSDELEFDEEVVRRMDELKSIIALIYFEIVLLDVLVVSDARRVLLDFLIGLRNRKNARKIHSEQSFKNKIHMGYIQPMLKKNKEAFRKYHILYLAIIYSLIPQYIVVCLFHLFIPSIILYVVGTLLLIRILLAIFYRLELGSNRMSVYAQK